MNIRFLFFPAIAVFLFSCRSIPQDVAYFQDFESYVKATHPEVFRPYDALIKNNDQLMISVSSPVLDQTQVAQFNLPVNSYLSPGELLSAQTPSIQTYTVNTQGYINFPIIGKIRLAGLTRSQAMDLIAREVSAYLPNPIINFQILSYKVTILGEVSRPGFVSVRDARLTILDAIGAAGDLTIYGDRRNILLIRDNNGQLEYHKFDLTASDIFNSPYYYLQQNDVIYVVPNNTKKFDSHFGQADGYRLSVISTVIGVVSLLTSTIITIISLSKSSNK